MRKLLGIALVGLLAVGVAGSSGAATLSYTGSLTFQIGNLPGPTETGSGTVAVNGTAAGAQLNSLVMGAGDLGPVTASLPVTSNGTINSVIYTGLGNLSGSFIGLSSVPGGGAMGLAGTAKICLIFAPCAYANVTVPISPVTGVGMGVGGTEVIPGAVGVTLQHAPWTNGLPPVMSIHTPNSFTTPTTLPRGFVHGPATGGDSSAVANSGVVQLVTATKAFTSLTGAFPELPVFSILKLHFFGVPTTTPTSTTTSTPTPSLPPEPTPSLPPTATPTPSVPPPHGTPAPTATPSPSPSPSTTATPIPTVTPSPGECRRQCRADRRECRRSAREESRMCSASCGDAAESALESCSELRPRKRFRCWLRAVVQYLRCREDCRLDRKAALNACRADYRSCRAACR